MLKVYKEHVQDTHEYFIYLQNSASQDISAKYLFKTAASYVPSSATGEQCFHRAVQEALRGTHRLPLIEGDPMASQHQTQMPQVR